MNYGGRSRRRSEFTRDRPPRIDTGMAHELKAKGRGPTEIAEETGINRASVYRILEAGVIHGEG